MQAILGIKQGQTQKFRQDGKRLPVTIVSVEANPVIAIRTKEKDKYWAVQLGYGHNKKMNKPLQGHIKGALLEKAPRFLREVRVADGENLPTVGEKIELVAALQPGDIIDVHGTSKGKGFAGGVKRYHFRGGPRTHGQSDRERAPGSIGQTTTPGRVYKGKRMAGKMGNEQVTVKHLTVAGISANTLFIAGLVPGKIGSLLTVIKRGTNKKFVPLLQEEKAEEKGKTKEEISEVVEPDTVEGEK
ncbi:MAG TPA: 50S ribosomal protein L3 [Patescibacteria group bacterium]|nr:50S ribosomal protein L3 [Patescibacteria group bacterium]